MLKESTGEKSLRIRRGRVDSVDLYEIKDSELDLLEKGSPANLYLNFAIFLLSTSFFALASLCTAATFKYVLMQTVLIVVLIVGGILGILLLALWYRERKGVEDCIRVIRDRIPPEGPVPLLSGSETGIPTEEQPQPKEPNA
jgi:hypothetical protein